MKVPLAAIAAMAIPLSCAFGQQDAGVSQGRSAPFNATVQIVAYSMTGGFLGAPTVRAFETWDHHNLADRFHDGKAEGVPFGLYRMEADSKSFLPEVRYVEVYRPTVTVVVGLPAGTDESALTASPRVRGRIVGHLPDAKAFVKLVGIYSGQSLESKIDADGRFEFGVRWGGRYLLLVVSEHGILASRVVVAPQDGPPLEIAVGQNAIRSN